MLWTIRIVLVLVAVLSILTLVGWPFDVTLWDWLDLLIIPVVLAIGGFLFTRSENRATRAAAERRALDDTLQAYLDGMSQLLTDKDQPLHSAQPGDSLSTLARARTLTVLGRLDSVRKWSVLQFLHESGLIHREQSLLDEGGLIERRHNIVSLKQADLSEADLNAADLSGADLDEAFLYKAWLDETNLKEADLSEANLIEAWLSKADLSEALLRGAVLSKANLAGADLSGAKGWTEEQLSEAGSLEGATMPNGQKYEYWLKGKESRGEDGKNSGP